jgi:predicted CXXCH cytochrome family protein
MAILVIFLVAGYVAKQYFTPDSYYRFGPYRADYVQEATADKVHYQGPDSCQACHAERHAEWSAGAHRAVKCEACHGPAGAHPASGKFPVPEDSIRLCTLCHEATPGRPAFQPQIVVNEHPFKHDEPLQCKNCHNPHSPRIGAAKPVASPVTSATTAAVETPAASSDSANIQQLIPSCNGCHGADGRGMATFPPLAGLAADYLAEQLRNYRSGERQDPSMNMFSKPLSDDEITALAEYYASVAAE